ncbi:MAG: hypothetical protein JST28_00210 [Acidobacteria bacterium]|nr:hypothetical protein [Acidobacteriota bacterium]
MRKLMILPCLTLLMLVSTSALLAQESTNHSNTAKPNENSTHYFHLEFVVQELGADAKPINSRSYSMTASSARGVSMRTGSKFPVLTEAGKSNAYQYVDLGINFDVSDVQEIASKLAVYVTADVSSLAGENKSIPSNPPVIRNNRWQAPILLPLNKSTVIFTSDALDTKGSMQVLVTATPLQ